MKLWTGLTIFSTAAIALILYFAYIGGIPKFISIIPYYDKIGHFVLFGIWSYIFWRVTKRKIVYKIPLSPMVLSVFVVAEEYLQALSINRTASISDLIFSLAGVWVVIILDKKL